MGQGKVRGFRLAVLASMISTVALSGCGGGSVLGSLGGGGGTTLTVVPAKGRFEAGCRVNVLDNAGNTLGAATTDASGVAAVTISSLPTGKPIRVQAGGNAGCKYYDEGLGVYANSNAPLNALIPSSYYPSLQAASANVAVTPATDQAFSAASAVAGGANFSDDAAMSGVAVGKTQNAGAPSNMFSITLNDVPASGYTPPAGSTYGTYLQNTANTLVVSAAAQTGISVSQYRTVVQSMAAGFSSASAAQAAGGGITAASATAANAVDRLAIVQVNSAQAALTALQSVGITSGAQFTAVASAVQQAITNAGFSPASATAMFNTVSAAAAANAAAAQAQAVALLQVAQQGALVQADLTTGLRQITPGIRGNGFFADLVPMGTLLRATFSNALSAVMNMVDYVMGATGWVSAGASTNYVIPPGGTAWAQINSYNETFDPITSTVSLTDGTGWAASGVILYADLSGRPISDAILIQYMAGIDSQGYLATPGAASMPGVFPAGSRAYTFPMVAAADDYHVFTGADRPMWADRVTTDTGTGTVGTNLTSFAQLAAATASSPACIYGHTVFASGVASAVNGNGQYAFYGTDCNGGGNQTALQAGAPFVGTVTLATSSVNGLNLAFVTGVTSGVALPPLSTRNFLAVTPDGVLRIGTYIPKGTPSRGHGVFRLNKAAMDAIVSSITGGAATTAF